MKNKIPYTLFNVILLLIAVMAGVGYFLRKPYTYHGTVINPPLPVSDFALQTGNNETFRLSDARGKIVLLFFGYTHCPDVCPVTLATFKQVHERLGNDANKFAFVMVTADPERDTPEKVTEYVSQFNRDFIGLSGNDANFQTLIKELGVFIEKEESGSAAGYLVSHTSSVYVLDVDGNLLMTFPYGTSDVDMANDLNELLQQTKPIGE